MFTSPRDRRLKSDYEAMIRLQDESSIISFTSRGTPADHYTVTFRGPGTWRNNSSHEVLTRNDHIVSIDLTAAYPRMIPELAWRTPIFHPNVSASGVVCLGAYQTNWVPSLKLDELCLMLWDMIRYQNYDVESPYNREAALWARSHMQLFPLDHRPLRDLHRANRIAAPPGPGSAGHLSSPSPSRANPVSSANDSAGMVFLEGEVIEAEILDDEGTDILFID